MKIFSKQRGDTIIEVLLAMSIIGMVLGVAFGIANRSVQLGRDAQERTEALKIAESQLEMFKVYNYSLNPAYSTLQLSIKTNINTNTPFCIDNSASPVKIASPSDPNSACNNKNGNGQEGLYSTSIIPPATPVGAYEFKVTWSRLGGTSLVGSQNSTSLFYKPGPL